MKSEQQIKDKIHELDLRYFNKNINEDLARRLINQIRVLEWVLEGNK